MAELLRDCSFTHSEIQPFRHPELGVEVPGESQARYVRFMRPVKIDRLELAKCIYGRYHPQVPTHPAHLIISVLDRRSHRWQVVLEVDLPADPRVSGEGLS